MSGGSYNYLCYKDESNIFDNIDQLESMASRLEGLEYAEVAAKQTRSLYKLMYDFIEQFNSESKELHEVWRAIEWWDSCDIEEDQVKQIIEEYDRKVIKNGTV